MDNMLFEAEKTQVECYGFQVSKCFSLEEKLDLSII